MNKYKIRFNKWRRQTDRNTIDHVWRVFENDSKEYLFKNLNITSGVTSEKDIKENDYNIICYGHLTIDNETSTALISAEEPKNNRKCDECSECCKGWLHGSAYGHDFYPGKKCFFLLKTCSIYETRPVTPCQTYKCYWLETEDLPMWMRPDLIKTIITKRNDNELEWLEVKECGKKIESEVISWLIIWALNNNKNLKYQVDGGWNKIGAQDFLNSNI